MEISKVLHLRIMKNLLFIITLFLSSNLKAQNKFDIENFLHQCFKQNRASYRGLSLSIDFVNNGQYWSVGTSPSVIIDTSIIQQIEQKANSRLNDTLLTKVIAYIKFDDYSSDIFVNVVNESSGEELINPSSSPLEPIDGLEAFVNRWYNHLDSCKDLIRHIEGEYLRFYVQKNGELTSLHDSKKYSVLNTFLKAEKKWYPGILNGRVLKYKIGLLIPLQVDGSLVRNSLAKAFQQDECTLWSDDVYVSHHFIKRQKLNVVSLVLYNGKYVSPIVHQGDLKQCENLIQFIQQQKKQIYFGGYYSEQFDRIYFYTYNE